MRELYFTDPSGPQEVEREWHHDEGQNRHREEVEGGVVVLELIVFATLLAFEVVLEIWHRIYLLFIKLRTRMNE